MKNFRKYLPLFLCLIVTQLVAADTAKVKVLDHFYTIDPKTVNGGNCKLKAVTTTNPEHHKAVEIVADFAKAGAWYSFNKKFEPGTVKPNKYLGYRFWAKSNTETVVGTGFGRASKRKDEKLGGFGAGSFKLTETWTQYSVLFSKGNRNGDKFWKAGKQVIIQGGGPPDDDDIEELTNIGFWFDVNSKGTAVSSHMLIHGLELIEK